METNSIRELKLYPGRYPVIVTRVVDGDTVECILQPDTGGVVNRIVGRLSGIDTPESRTLDLEEKAHGLACKYYLEELIQGQTLFATVTAADRNEKFGRVLLGLWIENNPESINTTMLKHTTANEYHGERKPHFDSAAAAACTNGVYLKCLATARDTLHPKKPASK